MSQKGAPPKANITLTRSQEETEALARFQDFLNRPGGVAAVMSGMDAWDEELHRASEAQRAELSRQVDELKEKVSESRAAEGEARQRWDSAKLQLRDDEIALKARLDELNEHVKRIKKIKTKR